MVVLLISLPIELAIRENSPLFVALLWMRRCFASAARFPSADLLRIESTHDLNSFVRSWIDIWTEVMTVDGEEL